jgi:hypothetical protein
LDYVTNASKKRNNPQKNARQRKEDEKQTKKPETGEWLMKCTV